MNSTYRYPTAQEWVRLSYRAQLLHEIFFFTRELGTQYPLFTTHDRPIFTIHRN